MKLSNYIKDNYDSARQFALNNGYKTQQVYTMLSHGGYTVSVTDSKTELVPPSKRRELVHL